MTKKGSSRFDYITPLTPDEPKVDEQRTLVKAPKHDVLQTVPKGQGRMEQDRTQLNIRVPTMLKRRAGAKATLEGRSLGEVVEEFLRTYIDD